jgi:hypothetical protein
MGFKIDYTEIKIHALEEAISYPEYKEEKEGIVIEVDIFDFDMITDKIKNNIKLADLDSAKINLTLEIIKILDKNRIKFHIDRVGCISLCWRALPIIIIRLNKEYSQKRMMYVGLKLYKDKLQEEITDKKLSRVAAVGIGSIILLGGAITGYVFMKNNGS